VVNEKNNGYILLTSKGRFEGFEGLWCERDGVRSDNNITIFAVTDFKLTVTPDEFHYGDTLQMECSYNFTPETNLQYTAYLMHVVGSCYPDDPCNSTLFLRLDHDSDDAENNKGAVLFKDASHLFDVVPSDDKSRFYANVTLRDRQQSQGRFSCWLFIEERSYMDTREWNTDYQEIVTTTTSGPTTVPETTTEAEEDTTTEKVPNNAYCSTHNLLLLTFVSILCRILS